MRSRTSIGRVRDQYQPTTSARHYGSWARCPQMLTSRICYKKQFLTVTSWKYIRWVWICHLSVYYECNVQFWPLTSSHQIVFIYFLLFMIIARHRLLPTRFATWAIKIPRRIFQYLINDAQSCIDDWCVVMIIVSFSIQFNSIIYFKRKSNPM